MKIDDIKKKHNLKDKDLAECLNMKPSVYYNSSAKNRYENAFVNFYNKVAEKK